MVVINTLYQLVTFHFIDGEEKTYDIYDSFNDYFNRLVKKDAPVGSLFNEISSKKTRICAFGEVSKDTECYQFGTYYIINQYLRGNFELEVFNLNRAAKRDFKYSCESGDYSHLIQKVLTLPF